VEGVQLLDRISQLSDLSQASFALDLAGCIDIEWYHLVVRANLTGATEIGPGDRLSNCWASDHAHAAHGRLKESGLPVDRPLKHAADYSSRFAMSWAGHVPQLEAMWTSTWAEVAPKQVQLGAKLRHVGPKLGPSWSHVGWAQLGALLADVEDMRGRNGASGRC